MCSNFFLFFFPWREKTEKGEGVSKNQTHPLDGPTPMGICFWKQIVEEKISLVRCPPITLFNRKKSLGGRALDMWNEFSEAYSPMPIAHNFRHVLNDA